MKSSRARTPDPPRLEPLAGPRAHTGDAGSPGDWRLRAAQSSLRETQSIARLGSWDFDVATQTAEWSDETYRIIGVDPETFTPSYEAFMARIHPDDRAAFHENYARSVAEHTPHDLDLRILMDDGTIKYIHTRGRTYYDEDGRPVRSIGTVLDVTERRQAELALARSERRFRHLVETISEMIWETDEHGNLTYVSPAIEKLLGYTPDEVISKPFSYLMRPFETARVGERMRKALTKKSRSYALESSLLRKDGSEIEVESSIAPVTNEDNEIVGFRGITHDISERKQTEARLKKSEMQLANALSLSRAAPWEFDVATNLFTFNDMFYAIFGTTAEAVGGYQMTPEAYARRFVHPDDIPSVAGEVQLALESSDPEFSREIVDRFIRANGEIGTLAVQIRVLQDERNRTIKTYGVNQDITRRKAMEEELSLSKAMSAAAIECSPEGVLIVSSELKAISYNQVFLEMWRLEKHVIESPEPTPWLTHLASQIENPDAYLARVRELYESRTATAHDKLRLLDGRILERDSVALYDENGKYLGRAWFFRDITERHRAEEALRQSEENFRAIFSSVREGIFVTEPDTGKFVEVNPSACRMFGYSREELIGSDIGTISSGEAPHTLEHAIAERHNIQEEGCAEFDWHCRRRDGSLFWAAVSLQQGTFQGRQLVFATLSDITERKRAEDTILQMACYDPLTGLLNRRVFLDTLSRAIEHAPATGSHVAVLYLDLDHFKDVNDILGHRIGDLLLKETSDRLTSNVRRTDTVARFGGDEFAVIASDLNDPAQAALLSQKLLDVLNKPYQIWGNEIRCGTSIGIATFGTDSPDAEALITHADVALYRAKAEGRGTFRFFTGDMDQELKARVSLANELREAIYKDELELFYQPEVDLQTGDIIGVEALLRWNHPQRGLLRPHEFVPAAERAGHIIELGRWAVREACRQAREWIDASIAPDFVAINLSALQFKTPGQLEKDIAAALQEYRVPPQRLELELTETVLMDASRRSNETLLRLREQGVRVAIDDFGTGYSSLDYLRRFHVDRIKIAQNFVADIEKVPGVRAIVRAALGLARELGLGVIAEGIETQEQLELLKSWGCNEGQGYYFARPLRADDIAKLLRSRPSLDSVGDAPEKSRAGL